MLLQSPAASASELPSATDTLQTELTSRARRRRAGAAALGATLLALTGWALTRRADEPSRPHVVAPLSAAPLERAAVAEPERAPDVPQGAAPPLSPSEPRPATPTQPPSAAHAKPTSSPRKPEGPRAEAPALDARKPDPSAESPRAEVPQPAAAPPSAAEILKQAQTELIQGHLVLAADLYERATRTDPSSAAAFRGLGLVSERLGRKDAAIRALRRAISLAPDDPKNALLEARVHKLEGS